MLAYRRNRMIAACQSFGAAVVSGFTWNPSDKDAGVTLSGGDLVASIAASDFHNVRATSSKTTGKWYFEVALASVGANTSVGLANASASLTGYLGSESHSIGFFSTGFVATNNVDQGGGFTFTGGDVVGIAFDADADLVWASKNGTFLRFGSTVDPSAGTDGLAVTMGTYFPAFGGNGGSGTVQFAGSQTYSPPSGFTAFG